MADGEKGRVVHYKIATLFQGGALDLQSLVQEAVDALKDVEEREETIVEGGSTRRVLSGVGKTNGMFTAKLMQYTAGQKQKYLEKDDAAGDYKVDSISPPTAAGNKKKSEFIESIQYVAIFQDHVAYIGTQTLGSKALEDHLNWLLRSRGKLAAEDYLILKDQISAKATEDISKHHVDKVIIGGDLDFEAVETVPAKKKAKGLEHVAGYKMLKPVGDGAEALRALLGDWFGDAPLKAALNRNENIGFKIELSYRSRKKTDEGFELMEKLAIAGRHFDIGDTRIKLHGGGELKGDDLKLQKTIQIKVHDSGLLAEPDVWQRIHLWLQSAIAKKVVG